MPEEKADEAIRLVAGAGYAATVIGRIAGGPKRVVLAKQGLVGEGERFLRSHI